MSSEPKSLAAQIAADIGEAPWSALEPHAARHALIRVAMDLSLAEVGLAIAEDRKAEVSAWLSSGLIGRPTTTDTERYAARGGVFRFVIIQPYVLFQERLDS